MKRALTIAVFKDIEIGLNFRRRNGFSRTETSIFEPSGHAAFYMALRTS